MPSLIKKLIAHKYVLGNFVARDLKVKYRGTVLGYLWSLLEPLSLVVIYYFLFVVIARAGDAIYPLTVILGVLPFNFMSQIVTGGATALTANSGLIKRVYIPREVFVLSVVGSNLVTYLLSLVAVIPFLFVYHVTPGLGLLWLPVVIVAMTLLSTGVALFMACANAIYRDVSYVLRVGMRMLFYASPIIYSIKNVPEAIKEPYLLNPVSVWLSLHRTAFLDQPLGMELRHVAVAAVVSLAVFFAGAWFFERHEKQAVKFL